METPVATPVRSLYGIGPYREFLFPVLALISAALLPFAWIAYVFVVVGHAHFLMAYRYQYKAKKMNFRYLAVAVLLLAGAMTYFMTDLGILPVLLVAGVLFAFHFALDEFTLHNEQLTLHATLTALGFALVFSVLIMGVVFPKVDIFGLIAAGILAAGIVLRFLLKRAPVSPAERYLWIVGAILIFLAVVVGLPHQVLGVVLLLHFANWYMGYAGRLKSDPVRAREYWITFAITLIVPLALFMLWKLQYAPVLSVFFGLAFYYAWAIAHIILSFMTMRPLRA